MAKDINSYELEDGGLFFAPNEEQTEYANGGFKYTPPINKRVMPRDNVDHVSRPRNEFFEVRKPASTKGEIKAALAAGSLFLPPPFNYGASVLGSGIDFYDAYNEKDPDIRNGLLAEGALGLIPYSKAINAAKTISNAKKAERAVNVVKGLKGLNQGADTKDLFNVSDSTIYIPPVIKNKIPSKPIPSKPIPSKPATNYSKKTYDVYHSKDNKTVTVDGKKMTQDQFNNDFFKSHPGANYVNHVFEHGGIYFEEGGPYQPETPTNWVEPKYVAGTNKDGHTGYDGVDTIYYDPNSEWENINNPQWLEHEKYHHFQNLNGRSHVGTPMQRPGQNASDEEMAAYYNRRNFDLQNSMSNMINQSPELQFVPQDILRRGVYQNQNHIPGYEDLMYQNPNTLEGEARQYEDYVGSSGKSIFNSKFEEGGINQFDFVRNQGQKPVVQDESSEMIMGPNYLDPKPISYKPMPEIPYTTQKPYTTKKVSDWTEQDKKDYTFDFYAGNNPLKKNYVLDNNNFNSIPDARYNYEQMVRNSPEVKKIYDDIAKKYNFKSDDDFRKNYVGTPKNIAILREMEQAMFQAPQYYPSVEGIPFQKIAKDSYLFDDGVGMDYVISEQSKMKNNLKQDYFNYLDSPQYIATAKKMWGDDYLKHINEQKNRIQNVGIKFAPYDTLNTDNWNYDTKSMLEQDDRYAGFYNPLYNSLYLMNNKDGVTPTLGTPYHEISHVTDMGLGVPKDALIPNDGPKETWKLNPKYDISSEMSWARYMDPTYKKWEDRYSNDNRYYNKGTEVRARVNALRLQMAKDNFDWNAATEEQLMNYLNNIQEESLKAQFQDLIGEQESGLDSKELLNLFQNYAANETKTDTRYAENGGMIEMGGGGYTVTRSSDRKGKTHKVTGPDGTVKYFGDSNLGQHPNDPERKAAFYARHKKNLDNNPYFRAFARKTWEEGGEVDNDREMLEGVADILRRVEDKKNRKRLADYMMDNFRDENVSFQPNEFLEDSNVYANGGMIKRADGSYSQRGLWDNIRANKGSGRKPTNEMLKQEKNIRSQYENGGMTEMEDGGLFFTPNEYADGGGVASMLFNSGYINPLNWSINMAYANPMNWGVTDYSNQGEFNKAYASAKKAGEEEFLWNGNRYNTKYAGTPTQEMQSYGITDNQRVYNPSKIKQNLGNLNTVAGYATDPLEVINTALGKLGKDFSNNPNSPAAKEQDALRLYMGLPQKANTFRPSKYKQNAYELNNYLQKFPDLMPSDELIDNFGRPLYAHEYKYYMGDDQGSKDLKSIKPFDDFVMGRHAVKKGKDSKGEYLEYMDKFDFDTYKYRTKIPFTNKRISLPVGIAGDQFNKPFDIYGRQYYNDYGKGKVKMYYSDDELLSLDPSKKNFDTLALQKELVNRGYKLPTSMKKDGTLDGIYGEETKKALKEYQSKQGKTVKKTPVTFSDYDKIAKNNFKGYENGGVIETEDGGLFFKF